LKRAVTEYEKILPFIKKKIGIHDGDIKLLNEHEAFDKIMNHDPICDIDLAPYRLNFLKMKKNPKVVSSTSKIKEIYFAKNKYEVTGNVVTCFYHYNIISSHIDLHEIKSLLEIGPGNGNLSSILKSQMPQTTFINIDLPETLSHSIVYLFDLFPEAKILFPNEDIKEDISRYDYIFLTPSQINKVNDSTVDMVINTYSFQEMTQRQIEEYFAFIKRSLKAEGYFYAANRVEKIPAGNNPLQNETRESVVRFFEYPWDPGSKVLVYEICKFARLTQLDNVYIRLEQRN
jgi:putative sugar O-methyltransferase